jgi:carbonic anhydrase
MPHDMSTRLVQFSHGSRRTAAALSLSLAALLSSCSGAEPATEAATVDSSARETADEALQTAERALAAVERLEAELAAPADELAMTDEGAATQSDDEASHEEGHWSYEGETGPDRWAEVSEEFALCETGAVQSPIDVTTGSAMSVGLDELEMTWGPSEVTVVDNGHTIQANVAPGNQTVIDGETYDLVQFHFHKPSEHTVDTEAFPMELHFVHAAADGRLAVVGVLLTEGEAAPAFDGLFTEGTELTGFDPTALLPDDLARFRYTGSLTTPPCSEGVNWNVLAEPVSLSAEQIAAFVHDGNARPVQDLNGRTILHDVTAPAGS